MSSRPAKRARSSSYTDAVDLATIPALVDTIDPDSIAELLVTAAQAHPDIASLVKRTVAAERAKVYKFDYLSKSAWNSLNARVKDWQAYELAGEAAKSIEECVLTIRKGCHKTTSFRTKESGLETLRKIGKSICLSDGIIGREVRDDLGFDEEFVPTMLEIARSVTQEEKEKMRPWCDDKLVGLQELATDHSIFEELDEVINLWYEDEDEDDDEEDDDEEDDDEEDDNDEDDDEEEEE